MKGHECAAMCVVHMVDGKDETFRIHRVVIDQTYRVSETETRVATATFVYVRAPMDIEPVLLRSLSKEYPMSTFVTQAVAAELIRPSWKVSP